MKTILLAVLLTSTAWAQAGLPSRASSGGGATLINESAEITSVSPNITVPSTTPVALLSRTFVVPAGGRTVVMDAAASMDSINAAQTGYLFDVTVNGVASSTRSMYFTGTNVHVNFAASWVLVLPAGSVTVVFRCARSTILNGQGTGVFNFGDFIQFTIQG